MRYNEYRFLQADIATLEGMLERMKDHDNVIERIGLESRLRKQQRKLEGITAPAPPLLVHARMPWADGQVEPGVEPRDLSIIMTAAVCAAQGPIRIRSIAENLITMECLTPEAHERFEKAILELDSGTGSPGSSVLRTARETAGAEWLTDREPQPSPGNKRRSPSGQ